MNLRSSVLRCLTLSISQCPCHVAPQAPSLPPGEDFLWTYAECPTFAGDSGHATPGALHRVSTWARVGKRSRFISSYNDSWRVVHVG